MKILFGSIFHICNVHKNQNLECNQSYLQPYLYLIMLKFPFLRYAPIFDAIALSFLLMQSRFCHLYLLPQAQQNCYIHQWWFFTIVCIEFHTELPSSIPLILEPFFNHHLHTQYLHLQHPSLRHISSFLLYLEAPSVMNVTFMLFPNKEVKKIEHKVLFFPKCILFEKMIRIF